MTFDEAEEIALNMKWKVGTCGEGEECWCRTILPVEEVIIKEEGLNDTPYIIVGPAEMYAKVAERVVEDHNLSLPIHNAALYMKGEKEL